MKKLFTICIVLGSFNALPLQAQTVLETAKEAGKIADILPIGDVATTANSILNTLKPKLSLTETQSPKVLEAVTDFLKGKSAIVDTAKANPAAYVSKFGELKDRLQSTLKTVLTAAQFKNMLALKPKTSTSSNVLSHLFY